MLESAKRIGVLPLALLALISASGPVPPEDPALAIRGATLIDGTGGPARSGVTILIQGDRIVAVTPDADAILPEGAEVLDATGRFVVPGLADMHVHFGTGGVEAGVTTSEALLRQFLYYGVTTILNLGATGGTIEEIHALQSSAEARSRPEVYATGGLITIRGAHPVATIMSAPAGADPATFDWSERGVRIVATPEEMREQVQRIASAGMNAVKLVVESGPTIYGDHHPQMSPELVRAAVAAAREAGLPVLAHATSIDELELCVEAGVNAIVHLVMDPELPGAELLLAMKQKQIFYIPTLSLFVWADVWGEPEANLTDAFLREGVDRGVLESLLGSGLIPPTAPGPDDWSWRKNLLGGLRLANEAGVEIVAGTDTANPTVFPGYSMHHELELMVEAGLTPMEALVAATRRAAELIGKADEFGTIEAGKRADLLVLGKNPLEDIRGTRTLEVVVRSGRIVDREALLRD